MTWLSIPVDWPTNIPAYGIYLRWLTDQHTSLSIKVGWLTNIPAYLSGSTDRQIYLTIYPGWLTDQHTSLFIKVGWPANIPAYLSMLIDCDRPIYQPIYQGSNLADQPTYQPIYPVWLTHRQTSLSIKIGLPTNIQAYLSGSTDRQTYLIICPGWLIDQHTSLSILVDWPANIPAYLSIWHYVDAISDYVNVKTKMLIQEEHLSVTGGRMCTKYW